MTSKPPRLSAAENKMLDDILGGALSDSDEEVMGPLAGSTPVFDLAMSVLSSDPNLSVPRLSAPTKDAKSFRLQLRLECQKQKMA